MKDKILFACFIFSFAIARMFPQVEDAQATGVVLPHGSSVNDKSSKKVSLEEYYASLEQNSSALKLADALENIYVNEKNPSRIVSVLKKYVPTLVDDTEKIAFYTYVAQIEELLGELDEAQVDFKKAAEFSKDGKRLDLLLESARISIELGNDDEALHVIDGIIGSVSDDTLWINANEIKAGILSRSGDYNGAIACFQGIIEASGEKGLRPGLLLSYFTILNEAGNREEGEKVLNALKAKYPTSPEYSYALEMTGGIPQARIYGYPSPEAILGRNSFSDEKKPDVPEPVMETGSAQNDRQVIQYVQTGSFSMKENADYMMSDLEKRGFVVKLIEKKIKDKLLFSVLVVSGGKEESASELLVRLRDAGFDGFIVSGAPIRE